MDKNNCISDDESIVSIDNYTSQTSVSTSDDKLTATVYLSGIEMSYIIQPFRKPLDPIVLSPEGLESPACIDISVETLEEELKCPICLGQIDKTWTVMSCLHRFCSECLHRSLRTDLGANKSTHECPSCRSKMPSRRSSNPDTTYDRIIDLFTPDNESNSSSDDILDSSKVIQLRKIHEENVFKFRTKQKEIRKRKHDEYVMSHKNKVDSNNNSNHMCIAMFPWPDNMLQSDRSLNNSIKHLQRPYLKVSGAMKVSDIKDYIRIMDPWMVNPQISMSDSPGIDSSRIPNIDISVGIKSSSEILILEDPETLSNVCAEKWDHMSALELFYKKTYRKTSATGALFNS